MEQIELREALGELSQNDDPLSSLNQIMADIKKRITAVVAELQVGLAATNLDDEEKIHLKQLIHKMQFLNKLQQEAEYQEENLLNEI